MFKIRYSCLPFFQKTSNLQVYQYLCRYSSTPTSVAPKFEENPASSNKPSPRRSSSLLTKSSMVAAAFAALNSEKISEEFKTPKTDERLKEAKSVEELLSLSEASGVSRRFALKIVSVLADWCTSDKAKLSDFDKDPRFIRLCKILTKNKLKANFPPRNEDLSMVINVTADDEAARLINSLNVSQMVRVISMLAMKKRRSVPLLRSISFNISRSNTHLDLKQCADLLYGTAALNYLDDALLEKVCRDICDDLKQNTKGSAVVGSILTSLGLIRYKEPIVLDTLSRWLATNQESARVQDIFSLFLTLAAVNHYPEDYNILFKSILPHLTIEEMPKSTTWLDFVWSLVLLNQATCSHVESVLKDNFVQKVERELSISYKLKVLNINAAVNILFENYDGPRLNESSPIINMTYTYSKSKAALVLSVIETLGSLFPQETYLKTNINTGFGFNIDGECLVDKKGDLLPLSNKSSGNIKVAVMVYDFHDMCRGKIEPTGINTFFEKLLHAQGYKVLTIPYTEYSSRDKLVQRVQYLKAKLKELAQS